MKESHIKCIEKCRLQGQMFSIRWNGSFQRWLRWTKPTAWKRWTTSILFESFGELDWRQRCIFSRCWCTPYVQPIRMVRRLQENIAENDSCGQWRNNSCTGERKYQHSGVQQQMMDWGGLLDVLFVLAIHFSLFSISRTWEKGFTMTSDETKFELSRDTVAVGERQERLYKMLFKVFQHMFHCQQLYLCPCGMPLFLFFATTTNFACTYITLV